MRECYRLANSTRLSIDMAEKINKNDCSICLNYFTKPKIIDCHHTFCTSCLDDYVKRTAKNNQFRCPLCTKSINIPSGGVHDFPLNFYIDDKPVPMSVCRQHKKEKDLYCKNCKITLCYKCFITSHQGHNLQNVEDVESEHKLILEELEQKVQTKMASNKSIIESLKKEALTINQFSTAECEKVDQRVGAMCQILIEEGNKIKLNIQNPNLKQGQVMSDMTKDVEQNTRQMSEIGKQIREVLNRCQLEEILNTTPKVRQAISDTSKDFEIPNYECTQFQDGVFDADSLSKQIGTVNKPGESRFECTFQMRDDGIFERVYNISENGDLLSQYNTIQGVAWSLTCFRHYNNGIVRKKKHSLGDYTVKLQLMSPGVKCRAIFKLKIINIDDSKSLVNETERIFSNTNTAVYEQKRKPFRNQSEVLTRFRNLYYEPEQEDCEDSGQEYEVYGMSEDIDCVSLNVPESMDDNSYAWDQLNSNYILHPFNGFINSDNQITIQAMFLSIDYEV